MCSHTNRSYKSFWPKVDWSSPGFRKMYLETGVNPEYWGRVWLETTAYARVSNKDKNRHRTCPQHRCSSKSLRAALSEDRPLNHLATGLWNIPPASMLLCVFLKWTRVPLKRQGLLSNSALRSRSCSVFLRLQYSRNVLSLTFFGNPHTHQLLSLLGI